MNPIGLNDWIVLKQEHADGAIRFLAEYTRPPASCRRCGVLNPRLYRHEVKEQLFMDTPMHGRRAGILVLLNGVKHILALIPPYPLHPAARSGHGQRYRNDYEQSRDYLRVTPTGHEDERGEDAGEDSDTADEL